MIETWINILLVVTGFAIGFLLGICILIRELRKAKKSYLDHFGEINKKIGEATESVNRIPKRGF